MKRIILGLFIVICQLGQYALAKAEFTTPKIQLIFQSKDGHPISGVALTGILRFEALTTKDCSGFICIPSLPKYKRTSSGGEILGETDSTGYLTLEPKTWTIDKLSAKNLSVDIFTNGTLSDLCQDGTKSYYEDFLDLFDMTKPRSSTCQTTSITKENTQNIVTLKCNSDYTFNEIQDMINKKLAGCPK